MFDVRVLISEDILCVSDDCGEICTGFVYEDLANDSNDSDSNDSDSNNLIAMTPNSRHIVYKISQHTRRMEPW